MLIGCRYVHVGMGVLVVGVLGVDVSGVSALGV